MMNDVLLVCFNGPESTGKSEMAKRMAKKYNTEFVPEVAREIITSNEFNADDIIKSGMRKPIGFYKKLKRPIKFSSVILI
ncbi:MAG: AAA family ATPase [Flammeovirgaceae bacterium]|nr:AAA family ATPase [Flammeovirgaceae bacterium]